MHGRRSVNRMTQPNLANALAETVATMIQALRIGEFARARQHGLISLAVYASHTGVTVEELLATADLGDGAGFERDVVAAKDGFEVLDAPDQKPGRFVRRS